MTKLLHLLLIYGLVTILFPLFTALILELSGYDTTSVFKLIVLHLVPALASLVGALLIYFFLELFKWKIGYLWLVGVYFLILYIIIGPQYLGDLFNKASTENYAVTLWLNLNLILLLIGALFLGRYLERSSLKTETP